MLRDESGEWYNSWAHKEKAFVSFEQWGKLTDFWDEMMDIRYDEGMPKQIRDVLEKAMHDFPMFVFEGV